MPLVDGGTHAWANLMSLCSPCHSRVTNKWKDVRSAAGAKRAAHLVELSAVKKRLGIPPEDPTQDA